MYRSTAVLVLTALCGGCAPDSTTPPASTAPPATDVVELSAADARDRMAAGTLTARALTQAYLDRIASIDAAGPRLNAVIETSPTAIADAEALDAERLAGRVRGRCTGSPCSSRTTSTWPAW